MKDWKFVNYPQGRINGDQAEGVKTISSFKDLASYALVYEVQPKTIDEALINNDQITTMEEELNQILRNDVWTLVPKLESKNIIRTRWAFRNKLNEQGEVVQNKAWLVAQGYNQQEGIDFTGNFAFAAHKSIQLFQTDVKSAFIIGFIEEEVYVRQPPGIEDQTFLDHVFKFKKALYGLKQAPRAWYGKLSSFLLENSFVRSKVDTTLFRREAGKYLIIV